MLVLMVSSCENSKSGNDSNSVIGAEALFSSWVSSTGNKVVFTPTAKYYVYQDMDYYFSDDGQVLTTSGTDLDSWDYSRIYGNDYWLEGSSWDQEEIVIPS